MNAKQLADFRRNAVAAAAQEAGLFEGEKTALGARVPRKLIECAKKRAGVTSTTDVIEYALAKVALEDDFGAKLVALKGTIPRDVKLDF